MRILIIGGTYFLGKAFLEEAVRFGHKVTVLNRGSRKVSLPPDDTVTELRADRRDEAQLKALEGQWDPEGYDCIVDFCAYEKGDIQKVMEVLPDGVKQYVFISTCDVYKRGTGKQLIETAEFEERDFGGEAGAYILGKATLERELVECAGKRGMHSTSLRPAVIYGPDNYAPREGIFFQWMAKAGQIIMPEDADGSFQMVYVKDVAKVIMACLLNEKAYDQAFNVCPDMVTYQDFADALDEAYAILSPNNEGANGKLQRVEVPVDVIEERQIPMPFPMRRAESELYGNEKLLAFAKENGIGFTSLEKGLSESFRWFLSQG